MTLSYAHVLRISRTYPTIVYCMVGPIIENCLFGSMEEDEECDYDHTLID